MGATFARDRLLGRDLLGQCAAGEAVDHLRREVVATTGDEHGADPDLVQTVRRGRRVVAGNAQRLDVRSAQRGDDVGVEMRQVGRDQRGPCLTGRRGRDEVGDVDAPAHDVYAGALGVL